MPLRTGTRNNVVAGLFVIASAILAVVISIIVSGAQKRLIPTNRYIIRFSLEQGAPGIKKGTIVSLGGQEVGRVTDVRKVPDPNGVPIAMDIHVAIRSDVKLYEDAWAFLERPLLGTNSTLNIASAGTGQLPAGKQFQGASPILEPGELLDGRVAPPSFLTQAGYGPEQIHQVQNMILQASQVVERIDRISAKFETEVNPNLTKFSSIVEDIRAAVADFRQKIPDWTKQVDQILAKADEAGTKLNSSLDHADAAVASLRQLVDANRPAVDRTISNIESAAEKINTYSIPTMNEALDKVGRGTNEFAEAAARFNALVASELPNIEHTLANLRLASDQIKLAGIEVRRNPWKILYQPKTKELESELFFDAARTYAQAVSDLRAASEALQAVAEAGPSVPTVQRETAAELQHRLDDSFQRYKEAERGLLKTMNEKTK